MTCQYKDVFGKPGEGVHSYRVSNIAAVDLALTIGVAKLTADYFETTFLWSLFIWIIASIFFHWLFCVETTLTKKVLCVDSTQDKFVK